MERGAVVLPLQGAGVGRVLLPVQVRVRSFLRSRRATERRRRLASSAAPARCSKMYVPGFGEGSPERKAAINLQHFFNYIAVSIVLAQLECMKLLRHVWFRLLETNSLEDSGGILTLSDELMRLQVRSAYVKNEFEWDNLKELSFKMVDEANTKLMRDYVVEVSHIEDEN
ncbi:Chaperonin-like RbcX protein [Zea mays]|uniref:Chaperonin-like RbcX protein n=1 Tax=Zea mays TaxID=4577 RepID=K7TZS1_MAIZE|nr:Chaperonin-like RbcX protein [Zea mays]